MQPTELSLNSNDDGTDHAALLRLFVEHSPAAIAMFDRTMHYLLASRRWREDYGLSDRDIIGQSHYDLDPDLPPHWKAVHQRCLAGAIERSDEECVRNVDGSTIWLKWEVRPWFDHTGAIGGIIIFSELITEQKQRALALQQANTELEARIKARNAELEQTVEQLQQEIWERHAALRDRKQAEAERDRFFTLAADMFGIADFDGYFKRVNPAFEQVLGYSPDELLSAPFLDFVHPDDREATSVEAAKLSQGTKSVALENRYRCKDGSYRWLSWASMPYQEERLIYATARDITEYKQAERDLRESKQLLQLAFDLLPQRVFWKDQDFRYLGCNRLFAQDAQLESPEQIIGKDDFELAWKESAHLYRADDEAVMHNGRSRINHEEPQIRDNGTMLWVRTSKIPLRDETGTIVGVFGTYEDITDYKQAQIAVADSEAKFRRLVEDASDYIFTFSKEGMFTYISPQFTPLFGYDPAAFLGKSFAPLVHPDDLLLCEATYRRLITTGRNEVGLEFRHHCKDGSWCWVACNLSPIKNAIGDVTGYQGVMRDISDRKEAEAALQKEQIFLKTILENLADGIVACNETGQLTLFNRATRNFHGLPEAPLP
ncbi:MAG TPA: PAS domain S-box protein, partial [Thermosynechococcaceae cyanobacterium]